MIKIISILSHDGSEGIKIIFESDSGEKSNTVISADDFLSLGIVKGLISEGEYEDIVKAGKYYAARRSAIRMISFGQCSKDRLYQKLRLKGFTHECAKNASDFVFEKGYIDEGLQIENYLKTLVEKKFFGRRKVIPALLAKGYKSGDINRVLDEKYTDSDFKKYRSEFLLSKFGKTMPQTREEAEEMKKALYKQGY